MNKNHSYFPCQFIALFILANNTSEPAHISDNNSQKYNMIEEN